MDFKSCKAGDLVCLNDPPCIMVAKILMVETDAIIVEWNSGILNNLSPWTDFTTISRVVAIKVKDLMTLEEGKLLLEEIKYRNSKLEKEFAKIKKSIVKKFDIAAKNIREAGEIANQYKNIYNPDKDSKVIGKAFRAVSWRTSMIDC